MKALVLGGTAPHIMLVDELHQRGYEVILVDYLDNPPAKKYADLHIQESTLDQNKVLEIAKQHKADLVISACIDQANSVCCYVAEKLGLPHPYNYETSVLVTVKTKMKQIMVDNGIPTSQFQVLDDSHDVDWEKVTFPSVVKPADCNSSKGVRKVVNVEEGKKYILEAQKYSRSSRALVEGFVKGVEIQVDCFAMDFGAKVILTRQKKHIQQDDTDELNSEGSIIPAPVCEGREDELSSIACKIAEAFNLRNTPFFYQAIIDGNGVVNVLEFAPRVGGGLSYYILKEIAGFDAIHAVVNSYLGIHETPVHNEIQGYYSTNLLYMNEGTFGCIVGFEEARKRGLILESFVTKEKGAHIGNKLRSGNRVGAFIVKADSIEELKQKEEQAYALIDIIDVDEKSQIRKWRK